MAFKYQNEAATEKQLQGLLQLHAEGATAFEAGAWWKQDVAALNASSALLLAKLILDDQYEFEVSSALNCDEATKQLLLINRAIGIRNASNAICFLLDVMQVPWQIHGID